MPKYQQREGIFLEVGVGANDFCASPAPLLGTDNLVTPLDFCGNNQYIGIDMPTVQGRSYRDSWGFGSFGSSDIDNSTRESTAQVAHNFVEIEQLLRRYRPLDRIAFLIADAERLPLPDNSVSEVYMANVVGSMMHHHHIRSLLDESKRVLGDTGRLTIRENITPFHVPEDLDKMIVDAGFTNRPQTHMFGSPEYEELISQYGLSHADQGLYEDYDEDIRRFVITEQ